MANKINPVLAGVVIILAILLVGQGGIFSIVLQSAQVQYYNEPVVAKFTTNLTSPTITAYFNNKEIQSPSIINGTVLNPENQTIYLTGTMTNGTYEVTLANITQEGLFRIVAVEGNNTDTATIEVKRPYIDIKNDIVNIIDKGTTDVLSFTTFTPQGKWITVDAVEVKVIDPLNKETIVKPEKKAGVDGDSWEMTHNYKEAGNYIFKIKATKNGYDTKEFTSITTVTKTTGVHPIVWIWVGAVILFLIFFIIRRFRR